MQTSPATGAAHKLSGIMPKIYKSITGLSNKQRYMKLHSIEEDESRIPKRPRKTVRLGSRLRRRMRIKRPKMRFMLLLLSPIKLLKKVRDGYVRMMLSLAEKGDFRGAVMGSAIYLPTAPPCRSSTGIDSRKEDEILAYIDYLRRTGRILSWKGESSFV